MGWFQATEFLLARKKSSYLTKVPSLFVPYLFRMPSVYKP
jgi:hypothetical protein